MHPLQILAGCSRHIFVYVRWRSDHRAMESDYLDATRQYLSAFAGSHINRSDQARRIKHNPFIEGNHEKFNL